MRMPTRVSVTGDLSFVTPFLLLAACHRGTPAGTVLADWHHEPAVTATPPSRTVAEDSEWSTPRGVARYHFETEIGEIPMAGPTGPAAIHEFGPRHIRITLLDGAGLTQSANCMQTPSTTPGASDNVVRVAIGCFVTTQSDGARFFSVDADGHVTNRAVEAPGH